MNWRRPIERRMSVEDARERVALRRMQWQTAMKGNTRMLIWLGRQVLGQRDTQEIDQTNTTVRFVFEEGAR
jgi:hypothetical protein